MGREMPLHWGDWATSTPHHTGCSGGKVMASSCLRPGACVGHEREQDMAQAGQTLEPALLRQLPISFQVTQQALRDCLIKHSIAIRGELVARPLSTTQAADRRDALVKV